MGLFTSKHHEVRISGYSAAIWGQIIIKAVL